MMLPRHALPTLLALILLLPAAGRAQEFDSPAMDQTMERLATSAADLSALTADIEQMYRTDLELGRSEATCLLAYSWAADAASRTAHDAYLSLSALRTSPDMDTEAYILLMLQLRQGKQRVDQSVARRDDFDRLAISEEDRPVVERLKESLAQLQAVFADLARLLEFGD